MVDWTSTRLRVYYFNRTQIPSYVHDAVVHTVT
jgi:hypothetical protein